MTEKGTDELNEEIRARLADEVAKAEADEGFRQVRDDFAEVVEGIRRKNTALSLPENGGASYAFALLVSKVSAAVEANGQMGALHVVSNLSEEDTSKMLSEAHDLYGTTDKGEAKWSDEKLKWNDKP